MLILLSTISLISLSIQGIEGNWDLAEKSKCWRFTIRDQANKQPNMS